MYPRHTGHVPAKELLGARARGVHEILLRREERTLHRYPRGRERFVVDLVVAKHVPGPGEQIVGVPDAPAHVAWTCIPGDT